MGLRDLTLKEEYRSDRDDIISEFFVPCLSNCIEYDRCIEYVSVKSLTTLALGFENFVNNQAKMRIITGHRFRASDLDLLTKLMLNNKKEISFKGSFIRNSKLKILKDIVENHKLQVKIAIPNSEEIVGAFAGIASPASSYMIRTINARSLYQGLGNDDKKVYLKEVGGWCVMWDNSGNIGRNLTGVFELRESGGYIRASRNLQMTLVNPNDLNTPNNTFIYFDANGSSGGGAGSWKGKILMPQEFTVAFRGSQSVNWAAADFFMAWMMIGYDVE